MIGATCLCKEVGGRPGLKLSGDQGGVVMRIWLLVAVAVMLASPAGAQYVDKEQLAKVKALKIIVADDTKGVCLQDPDALKTEAELLGNFLVNHPAPILL